MIMEAPTFKLMSYEEFRNWFLEARRRKEEWEAQSQIELAEKQRAREASKARFAAIHEEIGV